MKTKKYPFIASSPDNPNGVENGLGFNTEQEAQRHCSRMNELLNDFESCSWNKGFWKTRPREWQVYPQ